MGTIPVVSGTVRLPSYTRAKNPPPGGNPPSELDVLGSAMVGAQTIGQSGFVRPDAAFVYVDAGVGDVLTIPGFLQSEIAGDGTTRRITVRNVGSEDVTLVAEGGTINGQSSFVVAAGAAASLSSVIVAVGQTAREWELVYEYERPDTFHFNIGNIGSLSLAPTPGVADPAAMGFFGQINISAPRRIAVTHIHLTVDGSSPTVIIIEFWRRRNGVMTQLTTVRYTAPAGGDFVTVGAVPSDPDLLAGDYLFCQVVTGTSISGGGDGLTCDVHYIN